MTSRSPKSNRKSGKAAPSSRSRRGEKKYRRAKIRNFLFTIGPNRLTGGRIGKRHLAQDIIVREYEVTNPHWPAEFDGMRVAHVSDFHLGELLPLDRALEIVERLGDLEPDFVACTGDVVDLHHTLAQPLLDAMAQIRAPMGSALVLGNHDELHCPTELTRMAEKAGMMALRNEATELVHNGGRLVVGGVDWAGNQRVLSKYVDKACGDFAHLLLSHNPKSFGRASQLGIPLTLAGHTHGGQVALKGMPNTNLAVAHRRSAGVFQERDSHLYVTTGVGAWFPLRVNCPAEIALITMRRGPKASATLCELTEAS